MDGWSEGSKSRLNTCLQQSKIFFLFHFDFRPSVRKSSGQTLFSTIAAHGSILEAKTWQAVLWQVLFPLLDNVIIQSDNASSERVSQSQVKPSSFYSCTHLIRLFSNGRD